MVAAGVSCPGRGICVRVVGDIGGVNLGDDTNMGAGLPELKGCGHTGVGYAIELGGMQGMERVKQVLCRKILLKCQLWMVIKGPAQRNILLLMGVNILDCGLFHLLLLHMAPSFPRIWNFLFLLKGLAFFNGLDSEIHGDNRIGTGDQGGSLFGIPGVPAAQLQNAQGGPEAMERSSTEILRAALEVKFKGISYLMAAAGFTALGMGAALIYDDADLLRLLIAVVIHSKYPPFLS